MNPLALHEYNHRVRPKWLDALAKLTTAQYTQTFPFGLGTLRKTAVHVGGSEGSWLGNLRGRPAGAFSEEAMPDVASLRAAFDGQRAEMIDYMRGLDAAAWARVGVFTRRDGSQISVSPEDVMTQLALHEVHHRSQIAAMMRMLGFDLSNLDYLRHLGPRG
ncbi:MAG: hypothetical protein FJX78_03595 [Armatimonadetes bacterium]|nr:hypothetical protein [Armatimonadota bacterium]